MKKFIVVAFALTLALVAVSSPALAAIEVEGDAYVGVYDKYLWRGFNLSEAQPVLQGGVDLSTHGFTLSFWSNVQLSNGNDVVNEVDFLPSNEVTETDIVLDYTHEFDILSISVGDIFYNFNGAGASTHELYLGLALDTILAPSFTVYYDWDLANASDEDYEGNGLYYTFGVSHGFDLMENLALGLGATVAYNDESPYVSNSYSDWHNYELSASVDYAVTDQISVTPSFLFSEGISDDAKEAIDSELVAGVSVTLTF